jgi:CheY-like chemotaxis protein
MVEGMGMTRILLVEDGKMLRIAGTRALTRAGYEVVAAVDGEEALRVARESPPDLILLDMMLPKVSGLDVLRGLKSDARTKHVPVIVLSGLSPANRERLIVEGAAAFFEKTEKILANDSADLLEAVKDVLASVAK